MSERTCRHCGETKPLALMARDSRNKDGHTNCCRDCRCAEAQRWYRENKGRALRRQREWAQANPERIRRYYRKAALKKNYNLTPEGYAALLDRQGGCCALCGGMDEPFHVDHDHACCPGVQSCGFCVRALLCRPCNQGVGQLRDNPALLRRAADYVEMLP